MNHRDMAELLPKALLGKKIREIRLRLDKSQKAFATALGAPGRQSDVSEWERGVSRPSLETLTKIAELAGESVVIFRANGRTPDDQRRVKLLAAEYLDQLAAQIRLEATQESGDGDAAQAVADQTTPPDQGTGTDD